MRTVSAADANRYFSRILRDVRAGETVIVTSRGEPVARITPLEDAGGEGAARMTAERQRAWQDHLARLRSQPAMNLGPFRRDELYDDDPPDRSPE